VDTPDHTTVVIALRHPSPGFEHQPLADMPILPAHLWHSLPAGQVEPTGLPVGSGPYRLVEHRPGELYRFQANDRYFRGPPAAKVLDVPIMSDAEQTLSALERRQVDMLPVSLPEDAAQRLQGLGFRVVRGPSYVGTLLVFNLRRPPFDRVEVRRAVAKALDLRRITRVVGDAVPAEHGYLHPASTWSTSGPIHAVDEVGARAELARLEVRPIRVLVPDNDSVKLEAGQQVALALQRVGLQASHEPLPRHEYLRALGQRGQPPFFEAAVSVSPPLASQDPDFLRRLFGSDPERAPFNLSGYRSLAFDALSERITVAPDAATRRHAVAETLRLLADDAPVVPLFFSNGSYAFRPAIYDGWVFVKGSGVLDKRSFMNDGSQTGRRPVVPDPAAHRGFPYAPVALGSLALAATLAAVAISRPRN
jgi:peptide/nickel transport system substrate-binding protein